MPRVDQMGLAALQDWHTVCRLRRAAPWGCPSPAACRPLPLPLCLPPIACFAFSCWLARPGNIHADLFHPPAKFLASSSCRPDPRLPLASSSFRAVTCMKCGQSAMHFACAVDFLEERIPLMTTSSAALKKYQVGVANRRGGCAGAGMGCAGAASVAEHHLDLAAGPSASPAIFCRSWHASDPSTSSKLSVCHALLAHLAPSAAAARRKPVLDLQ